MSFDWGGFTGGIIGTLGAFGAVRYSFSKQKRYDKPLRDKRSLEVINVLRSTLDKYWWEISRYEANDIVDIFYKTNDIVRVLNSYLGSAIEMDSSLVSLILRTIEELDNVGNKYSRLERSDGNLFKYLTDIMEVLGHRITECDKLKEELLKSYYKTN